jgi:CBS domain-containing protein
MNVVDVMTAQPATTTSNATLAQALDTMHQIGCHHLPVLSAEKHLIGVLSITDCQRALGEPIKQNSPLLNRALAGVLRVSMVMTAAPIIVEPDAPAHEAARLMLKHFIGCLPVMRGETLVGIVTRTDLLTAFMAISQKMDALTHL